MEGTAKVIYGVSLAVTALAVGLLDLYLIAVLRSDLGQVTSGGHRAYLIAVCGVLVGAGFMLLAPFAFGGRLGWGSAVPVACALGALAWLVVGAVAAHVLGL